MMSKSSGKNLSDFTDVVRKRNTIVSLSQGNVNSYHCKYYNYRKMTPRSPTFNKGNNLENVSKIQQ